MAVYTALGPQEVGEFLEEIEQQQQQQQQQPMILINEEQLFRHARELELGNHGRYLEGQIILPSLSSSPSIQPPYIIELTTVPTDDSQLLIHPNLLHVSIPHESSRRFVHKFLDWRIRIKISKNFEFATVLLPKDKQDNRPTVPESKPIRCLKIDSSNGGQNIVLILGKTGGLLLTVIMPLKSGGGGNGGVHLQEVFMNRLQHDILPPEYSDRPLPSVIDLVSLCTSRQDNPKAKLELHACRIRCRFLQHQDAPCFNKVVSNSIFNWRVWKLDLLDMSSPNSACSRGGMRVLLATDYKSDFEVQPVFVLARGADDDPVPAEQVYREFKNISAGEHGNKVIPFTVPAQKPAVLHELACHKETLFIALYRPIDKRYSKNRIRFDYVLHDELSLCAYCSIMNRAAPEQQQILLLPQQQQQQSLLTPPQPLGIAGSRRTSSNSELDASFGSSMSEDLWNVWNESGAQTVEAMATFSNGVHFPTRAGYSAVDAFEWNTCRQENAYQDSGLAALGRMDYANDCVDSAISKPAKLKLGEVDELTQGLNDLQVIGSDEQYERRLKEEEGNDDVKKEEPERKSAPATKEEKE